MSAPSVRDPKKCASVVGRTQPSEERAETAAVARIAARLAPLQQLSLQPPPHDQPATNETRALCSEVFRWVTCHAHMYVTPGGHVATGATHRLANAAAAAALPWRHRSTGRAATRADIDDAFHRVRAQGAGRTALAYRVASDLVLPGGIAGDLVIARLEGELLPGLRGVFRGFDRYPVPARRALVEMAFDLGIVRLRNFRNLLAACERSDFATAAEHCHRRGRRELRNAATRALFLDAENYPRRRLENERGCR